jgi:hypothetical protein
MIFYLYTKYNQPHSHKAQSQIPIPVGKWFHVEALNEKSKPYRKNGNIKIWFNGIVLFDIPHVVTSLSEHTSWGLGNYTDYIDGGTTPGTATIYFDDALVSTAPPHAHAKLFLETE